MSLVDTWAATGAGAFSLSENGLYTVEGWKVFLDRLSPRGVYTVSRWYDSANPSETARMLSLAVSALLAQRVPEPRRHIVLATQRSIATLLVSRSPFSESELTVLKDVAKAFEHNLIVIPGEHSNLPLLEKILSSRDRSALERATAGSEFDISPSTDDRPFFFNQVRLDKPLQALQLAAGRIERGGKLGGVRDGNLVATATLLILFLLSLAMVITTIVVPLRPAVRDVGRPLVVWGTLYFLLIGTGFMLIEIALLQRTSVFLGHPVYSLSILLFTLILATGIGSLLSDWARLDTAPKFASWGVLTSLCILALPMVCEQIFPSFEGSTLAIRAALCVAIMAPPGILMGFAFPTGMRLVIQINRRPAPWFWGVNGAAGVLASILAVASSIALGISATLHVAAVLYLLLIPTMLMLLQLKQPIQAEDGKVFAPQAEPAA
jgi:hypothetical protein